MLFCDCEKKENAIACASFLSSRTKARLYDTALLHGEGGGEIRQEWHLKLRLHQYKATHMAGTLFICSWAFLLKAICPSPAPGINRARAKPWPPLMKGKCLGMISHLDWAWISSFKLQQTYTLDCITGAAGPQYYITPALSALWMALHQSAQVYIYKIYKKTWGKWGCIAILKSYEIPHVLTSTKLEIRSLFFILARVAWEVTDRGAKQAYCLYWGDWHIGWAKNHEEMRLRRFGLPDTMGLSSSAAIFDIFPVWAFF